MHYRTGSPFPAILKYISFTLAVFLRKSFMSGSESAYMPTTTAAAATTRTEVIDSSAVPGILLTLTCYSTALHLTRGSKYMSGLFLVYKSCCSWCNILCDPVFPEPRKRRALRALAVRLQCALVLIDVHHPDRTVDLDGTGRRGSFGRRCNGCTRIPVVAPRASSHLLPTKQPTTAPGSRTNRISCNGQGPRHLWIKGVCRRR